MKDLVVDVERVNRFEDATGVYVRATLDGKWGSYDMATLTKESLHEFATSRGPVSTWGLGLLEIALGYPRVNS